MPNLQPNLSSLPPPPPCPPDILVSPSFFPPSLARAVSFPMSLTPLMLRSLVRLVSSLVGQPAASVSTLLYYSDLLPQNVVLERLVRHELLDRENYLFHFLINFLRCFW